jgi:uncharacterized membrane protein YoaK (UPF0700 family)
MSVNRLATAPTALSVDTSAAAMLLPFVLSVIAGSADTIGFLGLGGLFIAHVTGNLVILAARVVAGGPAPLAHVISVPVFLVALASTKLLAGGLERLGIATLNPLLVLQFLLLFAFLLIGAATGAPVDPESPRMAVAAMLGIAAMAVQNALVRLSLTDAPSTAVMTTNITVFTIDVGELLLARDPARITKARRRIRHAWPAIGGFALGCALGASCAAVGLLSLVLPTVLAAVAVALGMAAELHRATSSPSAPKERGP